MPPQGNQSSNSTPALPPGYKLDAPQSTPPLPPGYKLDSAQPPEQHWYTGVGDTLGREVTSLAKTVAGVPGGIYHAFADEPTPEEKQRLARNENQQPPDQLDYAADRMVVQPIHVAADWYKKAFQGKIPDPVGQALDVAPEAMGIGAAGPITEKLTAGAPEIARGSIKAAMDHGPAVVRGLAKGTNAVIAKAPEIAGTAAGYAVGHASGLPEAGFAGALGGRIAGKSIGESLPKWKVPGENFGLTPKGTIGKAMAPAEAAPTPSSTPITRKSLDQLFGDKLDRSLDAAPPPDPKAPIHPRGSIDAMKGDIQGGGLSPGHTAVDSKALRSYQYDSGANEFHARYHSGDNTIHVFGDVTPEEAAAFQKAPSKGQAMQTIKNGHVLVAKIINGKRVAVKGSISAGMK